MHKESLYIVQTALHICLESIFVNNACHEKHVYSIDMQIHDVLCFTRQKMPLT